MKKIIVVVAIIMSANLIYSQDYVDVVKLSANNATLGNIDNNYETGVNNLNMEVYYPKNYQIKPFY